MTYWVHHNPCLYKSDQPTSMMILRDVWYSSALSRSTSTPKLQGVASTPKIYNVAPRIGWL